MSTSDVSGILGQYMLKGWVLTDRSCPTAGCSVPLMRSPTGKTPVIHFCARCDGSPDSQFLDSAASVSSSSLSRSSTPPTEVSVTSSSVFALPAETEESRRRREQSDEASAAIGQRLLKGWAMLADECPNTRCIGIPLVRPPKAGGEKDPRKECVICKTVYLTEVDWAGRERLVPENTTQDMITPVPDTKGKAREIEIEEPRALPETSSATPQYLQAPAQNIPASRQITTSQVQATAMLSTLDESAQGLELTLRNLSGRLRSLTTGQSDPSAIGSVADAISKVAYALGQIKQLQRSEKLAAEGL
ncbi:hypothetical protein B0H19DRAFT_1178094 [Mycena capillaripes]|nr:hypothetical protein B0H19DRAFT_1178094 [Mycena capillaripes]